MAAFSDELGAFAGFVARNRQRIYIAAADSDDVSKLLVIGYKMGISRGDATCMNDLGALYYMGELVDQDYVKAAGALATAGEGTSTIPDSRENEFLRFLTEHPPNRPKRGAGTARGQSIHGRPFIKGYGGQGTNHGAWRKPRLAIRAAIVRRRGRGRSGRPARW